MTAIISIKDLSKSYASGTKALEHINLDIQEGEIIALLGPNGAGKTTLISIICGLVTPSSGSVTVGGYDIVREYRKARALIGLVPQEIAIEPFETPERTARFSRGLYGKPRNDAHIEHVLRSLSLWDKRATISRELSGGMKRRVLIAKALAHEPRVLFLDEPTAGVDVALRREMWALVRQLRDEGVTIILTTHYIEEAEDMADRIGVIDKGKLLLVEDKSVLMKRLGGKRLRVELRERLGEIPKALAGYALALGEDGLTLTYEYDTRAERTGITKLLADLAANGIAMADLDTESASLEDVFLDLVGEQA